MVVDSRYGAWHPQIGDDIHQQGTNGTRIFIPPYMDPIEPSIDPILMAGVAPITVRFDSLRPGCNVDPKVTGVDFLTRWPGGHWGIGDVVRYQTAATRALLERQHYPDLHEYPGGPPSAGCVHRTRAGTRDAAGGRGTIRGAIQHGHVSAGAAHRGRPQLRARDG